MHNRNIPSSTSIPLKDAQERATISGVLPPLNISASLSVSDNLFSPPILLSQPPNIMEGFGLPMSFGKKSKAAPVNMTAKLEKSKRTDEVR